MKWRFKVAAAVAGGGLTLLAAGGASAAPLHRVASANNQEYGGAGYLGGAGSTQNSAAATFTVPKLTCSRGTQAMSVTVQGYDESGTDIADAFIVLGCSGAKQVMGAFLGVNTESHRVQSKCKSIGVGDRVSMSAVVTDTRETASLKVSGKHACTQTINGAGAPRGSGTGGFIGLVGECPNPCTVFYAPPRFGSIALSGTLDGAPVGQAAFLQAFDWYNHDYTVVDIATGALNKAGTGWSEVWKSSAQ